MSSITRLLLNLSIGAKLGIASGLGVLLVATMVIVQMHANAAMRDLDARMAGQQTIARDAVEAKASIAGMQVAVRDLRLANSSAELQKANDNLAARLKSANHFADEMLKLSKSAENRARIEKLKTRAGDYSKGAQQIAAVRGEAIAAGRRCRRRSKDCEAERRSRPHCPRSHAADRRRTRAARQPDRRIRQAQCGRAGRPGRPGNGHGRMGIPGTRHRHDCVADRNQHILLLHHRPSDARA